MITITAEDIHRWETESRKPDGPIVGVKVGDLLICEGMGCHSLADVHAHLTWECANGAVRRLAIASTNLERRRWLFSNRPDLMHDYLYGDGWMR